MPRMPTIAAERRAARAELRATRRDAAMTTAEQAARTERLRELLRQGVQRHRRLVNVARDMHEQLQEAAHARAALVVENAALVAERNALRQNLADRDAEVALLEEQRDTAEDSRDRLVRERATLYAERAALRHELERIHAEREQERARVKERVDFIMEEKFEAQTERDDAQREQRRAEQLRATLEAALDRADVRAGRLEYAARHYYAKYVQVHPAKVGVHFGPLDEVVFTLNGAEQK